MIQILIPINRNNLNKLIKLVNKKIKEQINLKKNLIEKISF
jgi:hypothetical protein